MPQPESNETQPVLLNEKTAVSWPILVGVVTSAVLMGGAFVRVEGLRADYDILRARVDLLEHQQGADRGQLQVQGATLAQVREILLELKGDVREALRGRVRQAGLRE